nr:MAG TPA: hypothetical protein [Bacteriophage sp.]
MALNRLLTKVFETKLSFQNNLQYIRIYIFLYLYILQEYSL